MPDRSISYEFRARFDNFKAQFAAGKRSVQDFGDELTALDRKGEKMRRGLDTIAGGAGRAGLALSGMFVVEATKTANFDQAMSFVQAATHETADAMEDLRQAALDAGQATAFSATEAAGGIEELAKAGVETSDILDGGLAGALDLAAAGGLEVADAAETAATAMTQFRLEGEQVPHIADLLAAAAGKAQGSVEDISYALKQSGLVASQMGLSIEETTGTLAAFASAGLLGSDAGTSFRTMLLRLSNPTKESAALMKNLGIVAYDANGQFAGMADIAGQLKAAFEGKTQAERDSALATIFGSDAIRAAAVLYEQGQTGIDGWTKKVDDAGYAAETAGIRMDNLKGDLDQLGGALETAFIGAGDGQTGILRDLTQKVTDLVNAFNDLPGPVQSTVGSLVALGALGAGTFWFTARAVITIANTKEALSDLGIQAGSTRGRLAALNTLKFTAVLTALSLLGQGIEDAFDANIQTSDLQRNLEALASGQVSDDLKSLADDLAVLGSRTNQLAEPLQETVHVFGLLGDTPIDRSRANIEAVDQALANMVESGNVGQARTIFAELLEVIRQGGGSQADAIDRFEAFSTALQNAATSGEEAASATGAVGDAAKGATPEVDEMSEALKKARDQAAGAVGSFLDLTAGVDDGKFSFKDWIKSLQEGADALKDFRVNAAEAGRKGLDEGLVQSLQEMGTEGALQLSYLANASDEEIEQANRAWRRYQRQAARTTEAIAQNIADIDSLTARPKVDNSQLTAAERAANDLYDALIRLTGIGVTAKPGKPKKPNPTGINQLAGGMADGGTVPGARYPYRDKKLIWAAPGEQVISNRYGQADRFRADTASGRIPAYADGGTVGPTAAQLQTSRMSWSRASSSAPAAGLSRMDLDYLAELINQQARPLYGSVNIQPHNYSEFVRQQQQDRRRVAVGGFGG